MTIQELNKDVGIFMGWKGAFLPTSVHHDHIAIAKPRPSKGEVEYDLYTSHLQYHSSWEWLMPVLNKIYTASKDSTESYHKFYGLFGGTSCSAFFNNDIDEVYKKCVKFIEWYNKNK